jgi:hypothetical protein
VRHWLKTDHYGEWVYWWLPAVLVPDLERGDCEASLLDLPEPAPKAIYEEAGSY